MLFLFKVSKMKHTGVVDFRPYPADILYDFSKVAQIQNRSKNNFFKIYT